MRNRALAAAMALPALIVAGALPAEAATVTTPSFVWRFDERVWIEQPAVPPVLLALECRPSACDAPASVTVVSDTNPVHAPGAGAFTPFALAATALALRAEAAAPGLRLSQREPTTPARFGATQGYRARYAVQDRTLRERDLVQAAIPAGAVTLQVAFVGDRLSNAALSQFDTLLSGLTLTETGIRRP